MIQGVLVDRDGTINCERADYVRSPDEFVLLPGALEALVILAALDAPILIVTNQSCVGRGLITREALDGIHQHLARQVRWAGGRIDGFYVCPHRPDEECDCRKPLPGLLLRAMNDHGLNPEQCVMIGDSLTDAHAAHAAGVHSILVRTGLSGDPMMGGEARVPYRTWLAKGSTQVVDSFWHASHLIMEEALHSERGRHAV